MVKKGLKQSNPAVLSPHEELYRMQKALYRRNKDIIDHSILIREPSFKKYEARYRRRTARYEKITTHDEMLSAIEHSDIIYIGDYHTCNQSQRSFLRILKATIKKTDNIAIGFELIHSSKQKILDQFMSGRLSEEKFLKRIGFEQRWIFDLWANFKPLFDFAQYHKVPVFAIDAAPQDATLKKRDEATGRLTAKLYANLQAERPGTKFFIFIGDLHLAPEHLPAEVEKAWGSRLRSLTLYQNSESIYWRLAKQGIEDQVEVVKIDDTNYCRMHTPPVIAQQSYINWLEHEEGEIDYADAKHSFLELVDRISKFLGIKLGKERDDVEVYTSGDLGFLNKLKRSKDFSKGELKTVKKQILSSESYYIARKRIVYLANLSVNHAAEEATHFIKSLCSGPEFPRTYIDAFYANILHEALGFFGSKLVNSKRKCLHEDGFRNLLAYFESIRVPIDRKLEYEMSNLVVEYLKFEKKGRPLYYSTIFEQSPDLFMSVTHALGYMLGDKMYYSLKAGELKRLNIRYLFYDKWEGEGRPFEVYNSLREKVRGIRIPKRM